MQSIPCIARPRGHHHRHHKPLTLAPRGSAPGVCKDGTTVKGTCPTRRKPAKAPSLVLTAIMSRPSHGYKGIESSITAPSSSKSGCTSPIQAKNPCHMAFPCKTAVKRVFRDLSR